MARPDKYPFYDFYIQPVLDAVSSGWNWLIEDVLHFWWCEHCNKYHSCRVKKFTIVFSLVRPSMLVCSLGVYKRKDIAAILTDTCKDLTDTMCKASQAITELACTMRKGEAKHEST